MTFNSGDTGKNRPPLHPDEPPSVRRVASRRRLAGGGGLALAGILALVIIGVGLWGVLSTPEAFTSFPTLAPALSMTITPGVENPTASPVIGGGNEPILTLTSYPTATITPTLPSVGDNLVYTVQVGDTLWSISIAYNISMEAILAANPELTDVNSLHPDQQLLLPLGGTEINGTPLAAGEIFGTVATVDDTLRLRSSPAYVNDNIIAQLEPLTALTINGRTQDSTWLHVATPSGEQGWVVADYVNVDSPLEIVAVLNMDSPTPAFPSVQSPSTAALTPTPIRATALPAATGIPTAGPTPSVTQTQAVAATLQPPNSADAPYISNITSNARAIFEVGRVVGNRPNVFSKVGDSITASGAFLTPIGKGNYNLRAYTNLQAVIDYYLQEIARDDNSFANSSLAAKGGWSVWHEFDAKSADPKLCYQDEVPLVCEYRVVRPAVALIMLGTNDILTMSDEKYEAYMRRVIETSISMGVIPVISTLPDFLYLQSGDKVLRMNTIIRRLAGEYQIPLWDYWAVLQVLPGKGLSTDGIHPSWKNPTDFKPSFLRYGMTLRNLTALQALDAVWREVIQPSH